MKTIGIIGGTSWESTAEYYRLLNELTNNALGKKHAAKLLMYSFDWMELDELISKNDFDAIGDRLLEEAVNLENAGAELLMLAANTTHNWADQIQASLRIPLVHIADATAKEIVRSGIKRVLLLGTKYTMEWDFIKKKISGEYNIQVVTPEGPDRDKIHDIIYNELISGNFTEDARNYCVEVVRRTRDIEGVILGCTELPILIRESDLHLPMFDTTYLHAMEVVNHATQT